MLTRIFILFTVLISNAAWAAPDGAALYAQHCVTCHGENGSGGVGVPLSLPSFLDSVSNEYLAKSIRYGRPGRVMPAFPTLSDAQVSAMVNYIRSWSPGKNPEENTQAVAGDANKGAKLYGQHCASCHGAQGEGGLGTGVTFSRPKDLPITAPALNNKGFLLSATDGMIKDTLMKGRTGTPMISFLEQGLSETDINDIVAYVRSFQAVDDTNAVAKAKTSNEALLRYESSSNFEDTVASVKRAAIGANFKIIRVQNFEQGLAERGKEDPKKVIIYFCNFNMLNEALRLIRAQDYFYPVV